MSPSIQELSPSSGNVTYETSASWGLSDILRAAGPGPGVPHAPSDILGRCGVPHVAVQVADFIVRNFKLTVFSRMICSTRGTTKPPLCV